MELDLDQAMAVLQRTPAALRSLLAGLPDVWCRANEGADTWSPYDIVGHLIDGEETDWIARTRIILAQGANRRFAPFDRFAHLRRNQGRPLAELLDEFERKRAENLEILR
ncbi:MAG TPA: DinB family protein, partial [Gemmatimonadaceae bacterium]|nr:DinB family protein [Gemmatimonadaceae bacterium]